MSKRDNGSAVEDFIDNGVSPRSMVLYLAGLGNKLNKKNGVPSIDSLIKKFNISSIRKTPVYHDTSSLFKVDRIVKNLNRRWD